MPPREIEVPAANRSVWIMRVRPALAGAVLKRVLRVRRAYMRTRYGVMLADPVSNFGATLMRDGVYEEEMTALIRRTLQPGDVFVDAGANEGWFSVIASGLVGERGRVLAIEPQERLQPVLAANFAANRCANVTVAPVAVGEHEGEMRLHLMPSINTGATSASRPTRYPLPTQLARCTTLGDLFRAEGIERCDLLKVDVEGHEAELLRGAASLLAEGRIRRIALEYHPAVLAAKGRSAAAIEGWLLDLGYARTNEPATALYECVGPRGKD